jgi:SAM-dependent methyltransferase
VHRELERFVRYPIYPRLTRFEKLALRLKGWGPAWCPVCGSITWIVEVGRSFRETCKCARCKATNRQRQVAYVVCKAAGDLTGSRVRSLGDMTSLRDLTVYNTEAERQIHDRLAGMKNYLASDYFGEKYRSGDVVHGRVHQDLMRLSYDEESIDLVVSSDVFEHVPDPYAGHKEIFRVLRPGGRHVFTVPFYQTEFVDEDHTMIDIRGNTVFIRDPIYHGDPMRDEGALVHKIFSLEMMVKLAKVGFRTNLYKLYKPSIGVIGSNALVFEAIKPRA